MEDVTLSHAKQHLEELIARAARGEEITISDPVLGTVILKTGVDRRNGKRKLGQLTGIISPHQMGSSIR